MTKLAMSESPRAKFWGKIIWKRKQGQKVILVFCLHIRFYAIYMPDAPEARISLDTPESGVTDGFDQQWWCWELNLGLL